MVVIISMCIIIPLNFLLLSVLKSFRDKPMLHVHLCISHVQHVQAVFFTMTLKLKGSLTWCNAFWHVIFLCVAKNTYFHILQQKLFHYELKEFPLIWEESV